MSSPAYSNRPTDATILDTLKDLALDLRWSFQHSTDKLWEQLDAELWDLTHNPWVVLQTVSRERLQSVTAQPDFQVLLTDLHSEWRTTEKPDAWFHLAHPNPSLKTVAYFSMEFMLSEALPIYSGGLGNVAGDQLKTASNLGVPVVGVGLLYQQGYFRQEIDAQGQQRALYPFNDPGQLPIQPVREKNGEWLRFTIEFPGTKLWIRTWQVQVGRAKLYLLDTNDPANIPSYRCITSELYGGGRDLRLKQEQVLGIGGWRLLTGARPSAGGLSPERRPCRVRGAGTSAILHGGQQAAIRSRTYNHASRKPFHDSHAGCRGFRHVRTGADGKVFQKVCRGGTFDFASGSTCPRSPGSERFLRAV